MASFNKVVLAGNVGRDPDTRYTAGGDPICNFSLATSERWKDKATGEQKEETTWHNVQAFGRTAEVANDYLAKGARCLVEGRYRSRKWTDKEGNERTTYEVICDRLVLLDRRDAAGGTEAPAAAPATSAPAAAPATRPAARPAARPAPARATMADMDDDIPF